MTKRILKKITIFILTLEARIILKKYKPQIVAITGSVGKTSTKDAINTVLNKKFYVRASEKSFNSEVGVPLTILGCKNAWGSMSKWLKIFIEGLALIFLKNHYPKLLVVEVGTDRPNDIKKITRWLKPDVVVLTRFGRIPSHIEFFNSREDVIEEKINLAKALKDGGVLILNTDDKDVLKVKDKIDNVHIVTYGLNDDAIVKASNIEIFYETTKDTSKTIPSGMSCKIEYKDKSLPIRLCGVIGDSSIYSTLAAFAVGISFDINMVDMLEMLKNHKPQPGRLNVLDGVSGSVLIDDTYNSSPTSSMLAIKTISKIETSGRKIAVLGDMLELGKHSSEEHKKIGILVSKAVKILITVGLRGELIGYSALQAGMKKENVYHFENSIEAGEFLKDFIEEGDVVLIKGSQGARMEKTTELLLADRDKKNKLLVRQDEEWMKK